MIEGLKDVGDKPVIPRDIRHEIPERLGRGLDSASERTMTCHDLRAVFETAEKYWRMPTPATNKRGPG